jgi:hypothetical protein
MKKRVISVTGCAFAVAAVATVATHRHASSQSVSDIRVQKIVQQFTSSNPNPMMIDNVSEAIRPDGTRSVTIVRTFQSKDSPTQWESGERQIFYDAGKDITYEISPALQMYTSVPLGKLQYRPLSPMANCSGLLEPGDKVLQQSTGSKFGLTVQTYTVQHGDNQAVETVTTDFYPSLGCLVGDETGQLRDQATGALKASRTQRVISLAPIADDPSLFAGPPPTFTQAKPSQVLQKYLESTGKSCPECLANTGAQADARSDKLWARIAQQGAVK